MVPGDLRGSHGLVSGVLRKTGAGGNTVASPATPDVGDDGGRGGGAGGLRWGQLGAHCGVRHFVDHAAYERRSGLTP